MTESSAAQTDFYILFHHHTAGLALYKHLKGLQLPLRISPTPRAASSSCGMSLLVDGPAIDAVRKAVETSGIEIDRIVELPRQIDPTRDRYC